MCNGVRRAGAATVAVMDPRAGMTVQWFRRRVLMTIPDSRAPPGTTPVETPHAERHSDRKQTKITSLSRTSILNGAIAQEQIMNMFDQITEAVIRRGDLAHLALFVWASGASALLAMTLRDLFAANRRFDAFVRELSLFNRRHSGDLP
jgi:hypothetical protein